ncbi:MAG: hypothetical protein LBG81_00820 [Coriobacteriaceae bacterium]|jgi:hypothetical protein|nr:hypothetical protein [Coriobacteriaceae bacterium]
MRRLKERKGQMTVELALAFPVFIVVAAISVNVMMFFSECAAFDRVALDAIRICATGASYGESLGSASCRLDDLIGNTWDKPYLHYESRAEPDILGHTRFTATLEFYPTLFGLDLRPSLFGISLPPIRHSVSLVVDTYKPGVLI